jgi:hypothetical protein
MKPVSPIWAVEPLMMNHSGFLRNQSNTDQIFCIRKIPEEKCSTMGKYLFINVKKGYYSVWMEVLYNILIEFGMPMN